MSGSWYILLFTCIDIPLRFYILNFVRHRSLFCYLLVGYLLWNSWKGILTTISKDENHAAISIITNYLTACFPRSRLTTDSFVKFLMCSYERACWLGSRDLVFQPGWKILPYEHLSLVNGMKASWILHNSAFVDSIVLLCLLYFSHCKHPI